MENANRTIEAVMLWRGAFAGFRRLRRHRVQCRAST